MEAYPTVAGGLSSGFSTGVQNALTLSSIVAQKKQEERQQQELDMQKRTAAFGEIEKGLTIAKDPTFSQQTRTKFYNNAVVKNVNQLFGAGMQEVDEIPDELTPTLTEAKKTVDLLNAGKIGANDAKAIMADLIARHPAIKAQLEPAQELLKTAQEQDFQLKKQHDEQAFQASQNKIKADREANKDLTPEKIKAQVLSKYLKGGVNTLTQEEYKIIDQDINDPIFSGVVNLYSGNLRNQGKDPETQFNEIKRLVVKVRELQASGVPVNLPSVADGKTPSPVSVPKTTSFKTEADAKKAATAGAIKKGDRIQIGGKDFIYQ